MAQDSEQEERVPVPPKAKRAVLTTIRRTRDAAKAAKGIKRGEIDIAIGREPSYLTAVLDQEGTLTIDRILSYLSVVEVSPGDFFNRAFPPGVPPSLPGFLLSFKEKVKRPSLLRIRKQLLAWGRALEVTDDGSDFLADPDQLLRELSEDREKAEQLAEHWLSGALLVSPEALTAEAAERLCRILDPLGHMLRLRGDRNTAAEVLDLAFRIEAQLDQLSLRALIHRTSSYLLSDLGHLQEALLLATRAAKLCRIGNDRPGLGRSTYVQAAMLERLGRFEEAIAYFHLAFDLLPHAPADYLASIRIASAWTYHLLGRQGDARRELELIENLIANLKDMTYGSFLEISALIASQEERHREADRLFMEAEEVIRKVGNPSDIAVFELAHMRHLVRCKRWQDIKEKGEKLPALSSSLAGNPPSEAIILEVACQAIQGKVADELIETSLEALRQQRTTA